jgi:hypothetical protein
MNSQGKRRHLKLMAELAAVVGVAVIAGMFSVALASDFVVPEDTALGIRLDDTLTSTDSEVGDPFSATVVEEGDYQNARVYGHVAEIDMSGKVEGRTSMMLGGAGGLGTTAFHGHQKITLNTGQEMMIRITG